MIKDKCLSVFCHLLRFSLFERADKCELIYPLDECEWKQIFKIAAQQGVLAIIYEAVERLPKQQQPPLNIRLQWALSVERIESRYAGQLEKATHLSNLFLEHNIQTIVIKGLAFATYYPCPNHRECGDLDCFLGSNYELGNIVCEKNGIDVARDYYKNSAINYCGLKVENHCFLLPIRGNNRMKIFEQYLRSIILDKNPSFIFGTNLIIPSTEFNALYLNIHAFNHFLSEGIKLRHIIDWALLLKFEQNNIDWNTFYYWTDKMNMTRFVTAITDIAVKYLGLQISNTKIISESEYSELIWNDILNCDSGIFNKDYSAWTKRIMLVKNKIGSCWKYHKIYQRSVICELLRNVLAFMFERKPKL